MNKLTVKEMLNNGDDGFDPMTIDTSEIKVLSNCLPKDGNIDINQAEILATKYLRGADICSELLAIATVHMQKCDTLRKKAYSDAALVKSKAAGIKTDKSRAWYAESDSEYIAACNAYAEASGFFKWIQSKHESFIRAHYSCRKMLDRGYAQEKTGNFSESNDKIFEQEEKDNNGGW